jgi:hypothetical protein
VGVYGKPDHHALLVSKGGGHRHPGVKKNKLISVKSSPFAVYEVLNSRNHKQLTSRFSFSYHESVTVVAAPVVRLSIDVSQGFTFQNSKF